MARICKFKKVLLNFLDPPGGPPFPRFLRKGGNQIPQPAIHAFAFVAQACALLFYFQTLNSLLFNYKENFPFLRVRHPFRAFCGRVGIKSRSPPSMLLLLWHRHSCLCAFVLLSKPEFSACLSACIVLHSSVSPRSKLCAPFKP